MTNPPDEWAGLIEKLEAAALADASKHLGFAGSGVVAVLQEDLSRLIAAVRSGKDEGSRAQERVPTEPVEAAVVGDWKEAADGLCAEMLKHAPRQIEKISEALYETLLDSVQTYLRENTDYNLSAELRRAQREEDRANNALRSVAEALKVDVDGFPNYPTPEMIADQCLAAMADREQPGTQRSGVDQ
jgi:hypothetical protein